MYRFYKSRFIFIIFQLTWFLYVNSLYSDPKILELQNIRHTYMFLLEIQQFNSFKTEFLIINIVLGYFSVSLSLWINRQTFYIVITVYVAQK